MNRVIVFAAQQFLGFELCKSLLEYGYEVEGFDEGEQGEKWLEIGRNANVNYAAYPFQQKEEKITHMVFPYFDYEEGHHESLTKEIKGIEPMEDIHFHFLFSTHMLSKRYKEEHIDLTKVIEKLNIKNKTSIIYLPTVYGPSQPANYLYASILNNNHEEISIEGLRDDPEDVLFVRDVANTFVHQLDKEGVYLYVSNKEKEWERGISELTDIDVQLSPLNFIRSYVQQKEVIPSSISIKEGLRLQEKSYQD
ncbi:hypothetical protein WAK64_05540 [Bacillus spongiae]|uniref:NAD(P)-dependent oxidoreductase n=1 Tax=Bacillus spongiae TaxID=2683610 RepID=A0ABU8HB30_9BACI